MGGGRGSKRTAWRRYCSRKRWHRCCCECCSLLETLWIRARTSEDHDHPRLGGSFARHLRLWVLLQACVQHSVRHLIRELVRMSLVDALGSEKERVVLGEDSAKAVVAVRRLAAMLAFAIGRLECMSIANWLLWKREFGKVQVWRIRPQLNCRA